MQHLVLRANSMGMMQLLMMVPIDVFCACTRGRHRGRVECRNVVMRAVGVRVIAEFPAVILRILAGGTIHRRRCCVASTGVVVCMPWRHCRSRFGLVGL